MIYKKTIGTPKNGHVILVHGLGEHSGRYHALISLFQSNGYAVSVFDWPGHGKSDGKRGHAKVTDGIQQIQEIIQNIKQQPFLYGHSLGGLTALRYAELFPDDIKGIIASSPALAINKHVSSTNLFLARFFNTLSPQTSAYNKIDPLEISRNKKAVEDYKNDPLVHHRISAALTHSLFETMKQVHSDAKKIKVPVLLLAGTDDVLAPIDGARKIMNEISVSDKTLKEFPGAYHEVCADEEWSEEFYRIIIDWIQKH